MSKFSDAIEGHIYELTTKLIVDEIFLDKMKSENGLTDRHVSHILTKRLNEDMVYELIEICLRRDDGILKTMINAMKATNRDECIKIFNQV